MNSFRFLSQKEEKDKKKDDKDSQALIASFKIELSTSQNLNICSSDTCSAMPAPPMSNVNAMPVSPFLKKDMEETPSDAKGELISNPMLYMVIASAKKGFISASLLGLLTEALTDGLKAQHYTAGQIYWINQIIRGMALIEMGSSPIIAMTSPIFNYLLKEYADISPEKASLITSGVIIGGSVLTTPLPWVEILAVMSTSVFSSIAGNSVAKSAYRLAKNGFFSIKDALSFSMNANHKENERQVAYR